MGREPPQLTAAIVEEKLRSDRGSPVLDQVALARLIESGRFDRHLRRMRKVYASRLQDLVTAVRKEAPQLELTDLAAGFHALAMLPDGADEQQLVLAAADRGVGLHGLRRYRSPGRHGAPGIVFGFGDVSPERIRRGIASIGDLLRGTTQ